MEMILALALLVSFATNSQPVPSSSATVPLVTGTPVVDKPLLLDWPRDRQMGTPDLTEQTANRLNDLHGRFSDCDLVLSTAGNYHMALREFWYDVFLPRNAAGLDLRNWFFTTSPAVSAEQIAHREIVFGNVSLTCVPLVAIGPARYIDRLIAAGYAEGAPLPVFRNRGNVLIVKKGNPKNIRSVWDLGRPDVHVVTPNPSFEKGAFDNYSGSIYQIASRLGAAPEGWDAARLFNAIFNSNGDKGKWLAGEKIHHREVPWSVAYGHADVGVVFYHLALYAVRTFPDLFEFVPLGGTADDPRPLPGNPVETHVAIRIKGEWSAKQLAAREKLMEGFASEEFTLILVRHGLQR